MQAGSTWAQLSRTESTIGGDMVAERGSAENSECQTTRTAPGVKETTARGGFSSSVRVGKKCLRSHYHVGSQLGTKGTLLTHRQKILELTIKINTRGYLR